jgi:LuxR family maltose regulon positive regulatory protein
MKNSGRLLRELERSNLFIVSLDEQGEWYRYHKLFSEFLRYELRSTQPELVPVLHGRASEWFEQAGLIEAAISHALAAKEYGRVGLLIAGHWFGYAASGQMATVERWLDALPEDFIDRDAALSLVRAWLSALQGRPEESERFLALAQGCTYEGELPDGSASVEADVALVRGVFGYGGVQRMLAAARRAQELAPPEQTSPWAALVRLALGMSLYYAGEFSEARKTLEAALRLTPVGQPVLRNGALCFLSLMCSEEGHLEEAESLAREACATVKTFGMERIPQSSQAPLALGRALAARGKLAEAQIELEKCFSLRRRFPSLSPWPTLVGLLALAPVLLRQGDKAGARALLAEARSIVENYPDAGMFPDLLERRERELYRRKRPQGTLTPELTERELAVLRLLDGERSNREIGRILYVSPNTVKAHIKSIYRKLGVSSRKEAAEQAREMVLTSGFANSA